MQLLFFPHTNFGQISLLFAKMANVEEDDRKVFGSQQLC